MKLGRRLGLLFLLLLTCTVFWARPTLAQETNPEHKPIGAQTAEAVKCDELTEDQKKQVAQEAYDNVRQAYNALASIANKIDHEYSSPSGSCHFLSNTSSKWWDEFFRSELSLSSNALSGAEKVDSILNKSGNNSTSDLANKISGETEVTTTGGRKLNLAEYTDWDFDKLRQRIMQGAGESSAISNWAKTAKVGDFMRINDSDTQKMICARVQCQTDCKVMYRHDANSYVCMNSAASFPTKESDGKCYTSKVNCYGGGVGGGNCVTTKQETSCTVRLNMSDHYKQIAHTFTSPDDFTNNVTQNAETQKCVNAMDAINRLRGDETTPNTFIYFRKKAKHALAMLSGEDKSCSCVVNDKGEVEATCTEETDDENNMDKKCKTIGEYQAELANKCPTCELLATIAAAAQSISKGAFEALAEDLIKLLGVALLIYIAYVTLITIASPEAQKISKYLTTLLIQGFKVALTILILQNPSVLYKEVLGPILDGSVDFSTSLISTTAGGAATQGGKYASKFDNSNQYLDAKTLQNLVGIADSMNREATMMPAVGRALICRSFDPKGIVQKFASKFVPFPYQFSMWIEGCILYIFGYLILLSLIAYMLDCMVGLGLVCAIMAFCVACWPFKLTSNYSKVGWNMFLNVFFNFIMLGVVVTAIVKLSVQSVSGGIPQEEFEAMVNGDSIEALSAQMSIGGMQMLIVIVCAIICLKLPKEINRLANKFAGGAQISIGAELAGLAAQTATKAAIGNGLQKGKDGKRHLGGAAGLLLKGVKNTGGSIAEHTGLKGAASAASKAIKNKAQSAAGRIGLGPKAKMGAKGRDGGANTNTSTDSGFNQDR